jgi:8-oxo-dGTP pyrophosphatase MutT (NUDIX family)
MTDPTANPWVRRSRSTPYENDWIVVHHDDVLRPDGTPGIYGVVHFRSRAVAAVVLDEQDRLLLVGQYRYTLDRYSWEIPEGGSPLAEAPLDGIKRELAEETGYEAASWRELLRFTVSNSVTDETGIAFVATDLTPGPSEPDATEALQIRWVDFDEATAMIAAGQISDLISQAAILQLARERGT